MPATKKTPSTHHPRRRNVTTLMAGLKNGHIRKNLTQSGEPQRYSWGTQKKTKQNKTKKKTTLLLLLLQLLCAVCERRISFEISNCFVHVWIHYYICLLVSTEAAMTAATITRIVAAVITALLLLLLQLLCAVCEKGISFEISNCFVCLRIHYFICVFVLCSQGGIINAARNNRPVASWG